MDITKMVDSIVTDNKNKNKNTMEMEQKLREKGIEANKEDKECMERLGNKTVFTVKIKERSTGKIIELNPNINDSYFDTMIRCLFQQGEYTLISGELPEKWNKGTYTSETSQYETIAVAIGDLTADWTNEQWQQAYDEGCILDGYESLNTFLKELYPEAGKEDMQKLRHIYEEVERKFLEE